MTPDVAMEDDPFHENGKIMNRVKINMKKDFKCTQTQQKRLTNFDGSCILAVVIYDDKKILIHHVTKVRIKNRLDCCGERLAKIKVFIGDKLCGQLPDTTKDGAWYEVSCDFIGAEVKLVTVQNNAVSI